MGIFGVVFDPIDIFVPLPTPHHRADVRLVLHVGGRVASVMEGDSVNTVIVFTVLYYIFNHLTFTYMTLMLQQLKINQSILLLSFTLPVFSFSSVNYNTISKV